MKNFHFFQTCFPAAIGLFLGLVCLIGGSPLALQAQSHQYPPAHTVDVVDDYHGTKVADPYRWLEDPDSAESQAWTTAQDALTRQFLHAIPAREQIQRRLTALWNYPRYSVPYKHGDRYFFLKNDGLQNQDVLYVQNSLDAEPRVLIDPNTLSPDGTTSLSNLSYSDFQTVSRNGQFLAYALSRSGSDWQEIRIRDIDQGKDFDEVLKWCKFAGIAWTPDNTGFFYNRFPEPADTKGGANFYNRVYYHRLGTPQSQDSLVYEDLTDKNLSFYPSITEDGQYLVLYVYRGSEVSSRIYYRAVKSDGPFVKLLDKGDALYVPIGTIGTTFYFRTNLDAPRGRVIAVDVAKPGQKQSQDVQGQEVQSQEVQWREILAQGKDIISRAAIANKHLVVVSMHDAAHEVKIYDLAGSLVKTLSFPTLGSIDSLSWKQDEPELFVSFTSCLYPTTIFRYDFATGVLQILREPRLDFDPSQYETRRVFYPSKDGTRIPMFVTHKKGVSLNGANPTLLWGYGGFTVSITPRFLVSPLIWLEHGGVYALAVLRGGGEYGDAWHEAGMLDKKQNVLDDFIAAAEWLIAEQYTNPSKLAISGGSNGGLLVTASMLQRPELFGAVLSQVPVTDMLRFHKFTVGHGWTSEYGNAEADPDHFAFLSAYSPLHNIQDGLSHPPILVTAADSDDRVVPAHAKKFVATLQAANAGKQLALLRFDTKAGHGAGKPTVKKIEEQSDLYAFLFKILGVE